MFSEKLRAFAKQRTNILLGLVVASVFLAFGCGGSGGGGGSTSNPTSASITITPSSAQISTDSTQTFTATVSGLSNTAVTWSSTYGSIDPDTGVYTAPSTVGSGVVVATSVANPNLSAQALVRVIIPSSNVSVSVSSDTSLVSVLGTAHLTATVTGSTNTAVTWRASNGTITQNGVFTAPSTSGTVTITATSQADPTAFGTATITVQAGVGTVIIQ